MQDSSLESFSLHCVVGMACGISKVFKESFPNHTSHVGLPMIMARELSSLSHNVFLVRLMTTIFHTPYKFRPVEHLNCDLLQSWDLLFSIKWRRLLKCLQYGLSMGKQWTKATIAPSTVYRLQSLMLQNVLYRRLRVLGIQKQGKCVNKSKLSQIIIIIII